MNEITPELIEKLATIAANRVVTPMCPGINSKVKLLFMQEFAEVAGIEMPMPPIEGLHEQGIKYIADDMYTRFFVNKS